MGHWSETDHLQAYLLDLRSGGQGIRLEVGPGLGDRPASVPDSVPALSRTSPLRLPFFPYPPRPARERVPTLSSPIWLTLDNLAVLYHSHII